MSDADRTAPTIPACFESVLLDLSTRFVRVPAHAVDQEIEASQHRICECLGLDISALWQWSVEAPGQFTLSHLYRPLGGPPVPDPMDARMLFPWSLQQVQAGKVVAIASLDETPAAAAQDVRSWQYFELKSVLTIPLSVGGEYPLGAISFGVVRAERLWPEELVNRLQLVAQIFSSALARKYAEQELRESEARLQMAAESAGVLLWSMRLDTGGIAWLTEQSRELFGVAPEEAITFERFLDLVDPEDRDLIRRTVRGGSTSREEWSLEFRVPRADGTARWVTSRGRTRWNAKGTADCLMGLTLDITERKTAEWRLQQALDEVQRLKDSLQEENRFLRKQISGETGHGVIVGESGQIRAVLADADKVAPTDSLVLITGETGTGKELLAERIHELSARGSRAMVKVNCAALPPSLIESELFGREKGAFTGAMTRQSGRFELAHQSTLFLDEIADLPRDLQAKLLRVLQEGEFERLGSTRTLKVDVRVIAATNHDLAAMVQNGSFRADLFYRLNVFPLVMPPLRERRQDIPLLVWHFLRHYCEKMGKAIDVVPPQTMHWLCNYDWPGNVRELRNLIERAVILSDGRHLQIAAPETIVTVPAAPATLADAERVHILSVLDRTRWRISGAQGAADQLGMKPTTLHSRMKKLGIRRPDC